VTDFLASMAASSRLRADEARAKLGGAELERRARNAPPPPPLALSDSGFDLIAEAKLAGPSQRRITRRPPAALAVELAGSGAVALSILTEPAVFAGALSHLEAASRSVSVPTMRKDFLVDPIQVLEARAAGASGTLLIARLLDPALLAEMTDLTLSLGMFALVEVFEASDLDVASTVFDREILVGVNARDLATLEVSSERHAELFPSLPAHLPAVAESGVVAPSDARRVAELGYRLALVGTSLTRNPDPAAAARALIEAGRATMAGSPS